ncbi:MAG: TraB/GumN family protein [Erythrobacter sp.]
MRRSSLIAALSLAFSPPLAAHPHPEGEIVDLVDPEVCLAREAEKPAEIPAPVQDYEPSPAMWKIADEDTTIYLFGTYHLLPEGFRWRTPLLDRVVRDTDEVVFESRDEEESRDNPLSEETLRFFQLMSEYRAEVPLSLRIASRNVPKLKRLLEQANIPLSRAEYAPPLMTMFGIAVSMSEMEGSRGDLGVESVLEADYRADGRPISAIEDPIQVLESLFKIDESELVKGIDESLDVWDGCEFFSLADVDWSSEHSWAKGELEQLSLEETDDDPFGEAVYDALLIDRNREWAQWVEERMTRPGNLLLAVGAGHMAGPDSLVPMLEERGFTVERIQ